MVLVTRASAGARGGSRPRCLPQRAKPERSLCTEFSKNVLTKPVKKRKKISSLQPSPPSCLAPGVDPPPGLAVPLTCCSGENENLLNFRIAHIYRSREGPKSTGVSCDGGLTLFRGVFPRIRKESAAGVQTYLDLAQHWLLQVD
ncbi:hypothetical protein GN956_G9360 [Arapaima gigas]